MKNTKGKVKKKINRRNQTKYPALQPQFNLKSRSDEIQDLNSYSDQLNDKEKEWLNKFAEEYINGYFPKKNSPAYKKRLHKTKELELSCYNRNNDRNRCILSRAKTRNKLVSYHKIYKDDYSDENGENE